MVNGDILWTWNDRFGNELFTHPREPQVQDNNENMLNDLTWSSLLLVDAMKGELINASYFKQMQPESIYIVTELSACTICTDHKNTYN